MRAIRLIGLGGTLGWPTQPFLNFAHELAGRVRVIAGLDQQPILLHSDDWPKYVSAKRELGRLRKQLDCGPKDAVVVVWGPLADTLTAVEEIRLRYVDALDGVPNETRQPFSDGSTDFERILPGPDRMYPDTDSPPIRMTRERVVGLAATLPPPPWEREPKYLAAGVPLPTVHFLIRRGGASLVDAVVADGAGVREACFFFGERIKGLRRKFVPVDKVPPARWRELFGLLTQKPLLWQTWSRIVSLIIADRECPVEEVVRRAELDSAPVGWEQRVKAAIRGHQPTHAAPDDIVRQVRFYLGVVMPSLRGRVDASEVRALIEEALSHE